jgi:hypothetical protein
VGPSTKIWNFRTSRLPLTINNHFYTFYAYNDYIQSVIDNLSSDLGDQSIVIVHLSSKDGYVKVGMIRNEKIEFMDDVNCHKNSIGSLWILGERDNLCAFASDSSDKTIKL